MFEFKFDWCKEMESGIEIIDLQHKELFRIGRDIEQLVLHNCIGVERQALLNIVCELREYVSYHFYYEEELMRTYQYPTYEEHKKMHDSFKKKMMELDWPLLAKEPNQVLPILMADIQDWLFGHILGQDHGMCESIKKSMQEETNS